MQWFRLHHKIINDPVVQGLADHQFKVYINILCYASSIEKGGYIGTPSEVSFALRETLSDVTSCFIVFQGVGLIVSSGTDKETFQIPQWSKLQYKSDTSTDRVRKHRDKAKRSKTVTVTPPDTDTDTDTEDNKPATADCPHRQIINLYHETLPTLPAVKRWNEPRRKMLSTRWREDEKHQNMEFWGKYFNYIKQSNFLVDELKGANLEWFIRPTNFTNIIEGKYHD